MSRVDGKLDLSQMVALDEIRRESPQCTLLSGISGKHTGEAPVQRLHNGDRIINVCVRVSREVVRGIGGQAVAPDFAVVIVARRRKGVVSMRAPLTSRLKTFLTARIGQRWSPEKTLQDVGSPRLETLASSLKPKKEILERFSSARLAKTESVS
jgi:hypothetical protein